MLIDKVFDGAFTGSFSGAFAECLDGEFSASLRIDKDHSFKFVGEFDGIFVGKVFDEGSISNTVYKYAGNFLGEIDKKFIGEFSGTVVQLN